MEILEAYDLTGSLRGAAALAGCDHKTVARLVAAREAVGGLPGQAARPALVMVEPFAGKVAELVGHSHARIRADKAHGVLVAMGYDGSYRTTRRAVAEAKRRWRHKHGRVTRPWIPQPGKWLQWDYGDGPEVQGVRAVLFCAWLAWSRFRVVVPLRDKTMPSVVIGLDRTLRLLGGCPTYALTDFVARHKSVLFPDRLCARRADGARGRGGWWHRRRDVGHITFRARRASSAAFDRCARSAWCGVPPKCLTARWLGAPRVWCWC